MSKHSLFGLVFAPLFAVDKKTKKPRKKPSQSRAKATVERILRAAARILVRDGIVGLTTNHVAAEARISIGSLYQYFPNKESMVMTLMQRHIARAIACRPQILEKGNAISLAERVAATVKWHLEVQGDNPALFVRLHEVRHEVLTSAELKRFDLFHEEAVLRGLSHHTDEIQHQDLKVAALVVSQFLVATTQSATASHPSLAGNKVYEQSVVDTILAFLTSHGKVPSMKASAN